MQNMQNNFPICKYVPNKNAKHVVHAKKMQNNMYNICNKYANKYAEFVNKYVKKMQNMQNNFPICRMCNKRKCTTCCICKICKIICTKYATNMQINMLNV